MARFLDRPDKNRTRHCGNQSSPQSAPGTTVLPKRCFAQVLLASQYVKRLLAQFPGSNVAFVTFPFERGKQPADVFLRLVECYAALETIALHFNVRFSILICLPPKRSAAPGSWNQATSMIWPPCWSRICLSPRTTKNHRLSKTNFLSWTDIPVPCLPPSYPASSSAGVIGRIGGN